MTYHASFKHALDGIRQTYRNHPNFRVALVAAILVVLASFFLQVTKTEFIIILFTIILVIFAEMINTSIESMTNLITTQHRKSAKTAKDVSAGMVLTTVIFSVIIGLFIFTPYLVNLF